MADKTNPENRPIRPGVNQQNPNSFNEAPNQKQGEQWQERQNNDPSKEHAEKEWERSQKREQEEE